MRYLRGLDVPPWLVATLRGLVEAVLMGGLTAAAIYVTEDEQLIVIAPILLFVIRWAEGLADQVDKAKVRKPPA